MNENSKMIHFGLPRHLGYLFYCFRQDYRLTESEMVSLLELTMNSHWFKREYGLTGGDNHDTIA